MKLKKSIKKIIVSFFIIVFLVLQIAFLSYLIRGLLNKDSKKNIIMNYTSSGKLDYNVVLKTNDILNVEDLKDSDAYIMEFVDHISVTSLYNFYSTEKTNINGNTRLIARLIVYYKESTDKTENPKVLKREAILKEDTVSFHDTNYGNIQTYDIYLNDYLNILNTFKNDVKISVDGYLEIISETNLTGTIGGASYFPKYQNKIKIPLSNAVFKIESATNKKETNAVYTSDLVKTNTAVKSYLVIANIFIFLILSLLLKKLFSYTNKDEYTRTLTKILKNYDDVIVNTNSLVDIDKYTIIEITEFKELLNLSRELLLPIMNYEITKDYETWFYIIKEDNLYRYIISKMTLQTKRSNKKVLRK